MNKCQRYVNLFKEIAKCKPTTILEIGTWNAQHAVQMVQEARKYNSNVFYYGFDLFEDMQPDIKILEKHAKKNVTMAEAEGRLKKNKIPHELIVGNTKHTLRHFSPAFPVDFVFIDGGHSLDTILSDWDNVLELIHNDSVVLFDDYYKGNYKEGAARLLDSLDDRFLVEVLEPTDTIKSGLTINIAKVTLR